MDIIILAALAVFIFFKLREQLGKNHEDQKKDAIRNFLKEQAKIIQNQQNKNSQNDQTPHMKDAQIINFPKNDADNESQKILDEIKPVAKKDFEEILQKSQITANKFISAVKYVFESVLTKFADEDLSEVKDLISNNIYDNLQKAIKDRQKNKQKFSR